jgi:DNA-binding response OmpR family regulator
VTLPRLIPDSRPAARFGGPDHANSSQVVSHPTPELTARILVVDDDDALREMIGTALSLRGAEVVTAANGDEARSAEGRFDIALIDMMLDECRGDELLASLRRRGSVSAAMLVTGAVQKPKLVMGGEPDDWVRKPFEVSQLVERIKRTLDRHRMLSSVTAHGMR